jgi:SAM-dependent methyltransferase
MINRARERLGSLCTLKTGWAEDLPFEDNAFDLVLLVNTIEFLDDPVEALREAGRVAKRAVFVGAFNGLSWNHLWHQTFNPFGETLFQSARFFYLWELKAMARAVFGRVPMKWQGSKSWPSPIQRAGEAVCRTWNWTHCPACSYLGLGITVVYTVKTDNLPLKVSIGKAGRPVPGGIPMEEDRPCRRSLDR